MPFGEENEVRAAWRQPLFVLSPDAEFARMWTTALGSDFEVRLHLSGSSSDQQKSAGIWLVDARKGVVPAFAYIRENGLSPTTLVLLGDVSEGDRIQAIRLGADDIHPVGTTPDELASRLLAIIRTAEKSRRKAGGTDWSLDVSTGLLSTPAGALYLSDSHLSVLVSFADNPEQIISVDSLKGSGSGTFRKTISRLRSKIQVHTGLDPFKSVYGGRYRLVARLSLVDRTP